MIAAVPDWLNARACSTPHRPALRCGDDALSFAGLDAAVDIAAARLQALGVEPGSIVAVLSQNSTAFVVAVHAIARVGGVLLPLNLRLTPPELAWQLQDAGTTHLLHDAARAQTAADLAAQQSGLRHQPIEQLIERGAGGRAQIQTGLSSPGRDFELESLHSVVYTSGTTGTPKGAMLTYGNHLWSAVGSALNLGLHQGDRWLACLPLFHVGGLAILLRGAIYGTTAIVHESFDPGRVNVAIDEDGVTIISVVANMLQRMLDVRGEVPYPATLRCVLLGGGPAPEPLLRRAAALNVPVVQTYGLTEAASQVATLAPEDALPRLGSAGKPLFGTTVRILNPDDSEASAGREGEIAVQGPTVTRGYLNRPDASAVTLRNGWLHTGDIGYLDAEGYLYVLDRRDDLIVSGGENVYPAEIEAVLQSHPEVAEAGVTGIPHERWGQTPIARVVLQPGALVDEDALIALCRARLATYKVPSRVQIAEALPRNAAGKLLRSRLREDPA